MGMPMMYHKIFLSSLLLSLLVLITGQEVTTGPTIPPMACLIVRSGSNPYFAAMTSAAETRARELGIELRTYATSQSGVVGGLAAAEANVALIQSCVDDGAFGLLLSIASDDPDFDVEKTAIEAAREQGVLVLALDSSVGGVDALIQTNNTAAGWAVGYWAAATEPNLDDARIALLYCPFEDDPNIYERVVGFFRGFGLNTTLIDDLSDDPTQIVDFLYSDPRVVGARLYECSSASSAQTALKNILQTQNELPTIVYVTNEVGGFGALKTLEEEGLKVGGFGAGLKDDDVRVMTIDGSCNGVAEVYEGGFSSNIIQQPGLMAVLGLDALSAFLEDGSIIENTATPFTFAVDEQVEGVFSSTKEETETSCWGEVDVAGDGEATDPSTTNDGGDTTSGGAMYFSGRATRRIAVLLFAVFSIFKQI